MKITQKLTLLLVIILSLVGQVAQGAPPTVAWEKLLGTGGDLYSVRETADGGFIFGGYHYVSGWENGWVVKLDVTGNKLWEKSYGGDMHDYVIAAEQTADGGFILAGMSASGISGNKTSPAYGSEDGWVIRLDAQGNKLWDKSFGGSSSDGFNAVHETADGGFILGGISTSSPSGNKTSQDFEGGDYWLVKIDANGNKLWEKSFGGTGWDQLLNICATSDGGTLLGGHSDSDVSGNKTASSKGGTDYWVIRVDTDGNKVWEKSYGGSSYDSLWDLQQTADGGFILGGYSYSGVSGDKSSANFGVQDFWILKVDNTGNKVWDKSFGGDNVDEMYSLDRTSDGGFILAGESWSGISGNKTTANAGFDDGWVVRVNAQGEKLWEMSLGAEISEKFTSVRETSDGGFILAGGEMWTTTERWATKLSPPAPTVVSLSVTNVVGGNITVRVTGPSGLYEIEASTNLTDWSTVTTISVNGSGYGSFADPESSSLPARFYRVKQN